MRQFLRFASATKLDWQPTIRRPRSYSRTYPPLMAEHVLDYPAQDVSRDDAMLYCNWLSRQHHLEPYYQIKESPEGLDGRRISAIEGANGFRLLEEREWEYACRAMTSTSFSFGEDPDKQLSAWRQRWNSESPTVELISAVGSRKCNAWGLFDMHGNVWEWSGNLSKGVYMGWESAYRETTDPTVPNSHVGFRLAAVLSSPRREPKKN